jgi:hypothetical protein
MKEKKYEPAAPPTRVGKKQRKQKGPEAAEDREREIERWREECVGRVFVYLGGNGIAVVCVRVCTSEDIEATANSKQRW